MILRATGITWAIVGFLAGLITGLASCAPDPASQHQHVTTTGVGL